MSVGKYVLLLSLSWVSPGAAIAETHYVRQGATGIGAGTASVWLEGTKGQV